ncbi:MAG: hypothetical protein ABSG61_00010 [Gemmatimonadales bacterium]|jgi:hypothetical protein
MPITAKLSRQFYEKLGDEVANELVTWLNAVDQSYRDEFRDLFEANFARLEAHLGRQIAELRADTMVNMQRLETRLIRWMFGFWIGSWMALAGTLIALQRLH